jgi:DNA polymerase III sliding clamp (beta) subunit (PCNA family)
MSVAIQFPSSARKAPPKTLPGHAVELLKKVLPFVSADETRWHLGGMLVTRGVTSVCVDASDGHRAIRVCEGIPYIESPTPFQVFIPAEIADKLASLYRDKRAQGPELEFIETGHPDIACARIDDRLFPWEDRHVKFPNFDQVFPTEHTIHCILPVRPIWKAVSKFTRKEEGIQLEFDGEDQAFRIHAWDHDAEGKRAQLLDVVARTVENRTYPSLRIGVNARYFRDVVNAFRDQSSFEMKLGGELDPIDCEGGGIRIVTMPMRL